MSNTLPIVTLPASASASVSTPKEPVPGGEPLPLSRADWDHLVQERIGIMHEAGLPMGRAQALALADTAAFHGPRPKGGDQ